MVDLVLEGMKKPLIAITMGDPVGVGPEVVLKALSKIPSSEANFLIIGSLAVLEKAGSSLRLSSVLHRKNVLIDDLDNFPSRLYCPGRPSHRTGKASFQYLKRALWWWRMRMFHGLVTAPVSKEMINLAGVSFSGHTEFLARATGTKGAAMLFLSPFFRVLFMTTHLPLRRVHRKIKKELVVNKVLLAAGAVNRIINRPPSIAVCGLNPHAGEGGWMGEEEKKEISPAIRALKKRGVKVEGPFPADSLFFRALREELDLVVAMYHDQGAIPVKLLAFKEGVNVTLGLPFCRTSPIHGTGFDRAGKGNASSQSMEEAIRTAIRLSK